VGHQPDLGIFVSYLISGSAHVSLSLKPCSVAGVRLEVPASRRDAHLALLLTPAIVRTLSP
jgi:phosphohistidine phosphatase SixA